MKLVSNIRDWYGRHERPISSLSLILGFVFDAVALKRVDQFWENIWVLGHLVLVALCMILIHKVRSESGDEANPHKAHFWLVNVLQFVFGGLLSVFLVFYFRSSDIATSWPFLFILALAFMANERLKRRFVRVTFQVSLLFLSVFLSSIFMVPIVIHDIGPGPFILSGVVSLFAMYGFLAALAKVNKSKFEESKRGIIVSIGCIFIGMNLLYFTNIIPPIPLSLKDSGIYHLIEKYGENDYKARYEEVGWRKYVTLHEDFHAASGDDTVYAYSAVFSPASLNTTVVHEWQYFDDKNNAWIDFSSVRLSVLGGRDAGFRTFSNQVSLPAGKWRVNVLTESGQVIGRLRFTIVPVTTRPTLSTKVLQ